MDNEQNMSGAEGKECLSQEAIRKVLERHCRMEDRFPSFRSVLHKLEQRAKEVPEKAIVRAMMATMHLSLGEVEEAVDDLIDALARSPTEAGALRQMLLIAVLKGNVDMVRVYVKKLQSADPGCPWAAFYERFAKVGADYGCRNESDVEGVFLEMAREDRGNPYLYRVASRVFIVRQDYAAAYAWASCGCKFMRDEPQVKDFPSLKSIVIEDNNKLVDEAKLNGTEFDAWCAAERVKREILR